jgi:hypothetical protein
MIEDYILDGGSFDDEDSKLIGSSSHFTTHWKSDDQLDKVFTNLTKKDR